MSNFFSDNKDLQFTLKNINLQEVMDLKENGYTENQKFDDAPVNYEDALDSFERVLDVIGDITGERIAPRARQVDEEGPKFENGVVTYHPLTVQNLKDLRAAGVMGVMLPREYGGLNYPNTIYTMMTEMVSRADASLQNLFGLQDIAETIYEFGSDEQRAKYLPAFATGEADGSMDLTEPDSGSDLQSVRLRATQDETATGSWTATSASSPTAAARPTWSLPVPKTAPPMDAVSPCSSAPSVRNWWSAALNTKWGSTVLPLPNCSTTTFPPNCAASVKWV